MFLLYSLNLGPPIWGWGAPGSPVRAHSSYATVLQVVPTTCYRPAIQQFVNKL
jgi:hypothetical protein